MGHACISYTPPPIMAFYRAWDMHAEDVESFAMQSLRASGNHNLHLTLNLTPTVTLLTCMWTSLKNLVVALLHPFMGHIGVGAVVGFSRARLGACGRPDNGVGFAAR